jgi:hypothetical protein
MIDVRSMIDARARALQAAVSANQAACQRQAGSEPTFANLDLTHLPAIIGLDARPGAPSVVVGMGPQEATAILLSRAVAFATDVQQQLAKHPSSRARIAPPSSK